MKHIFFFLLTAALILIVMPGCGRLFQTQYFGVEDEAIVAPEEFGQTMKVVEEAKKNATSAYQYKKVEEAMEKGKLASITYWECYDEEARAILAQARQAAQRAELYHPQPPPPETARMRATVAPPAVEGPAEPVKPDTGFTAIPPVMTLETINFGFDETKPKLEDTAGLDRYVALMQSATEYEIAGHADSKGDPGYNQRLSERRAKNVADLLKKKGIASEKMVPVGYGEGYPVASNQSESGRAKNRRVEIRVLPPIFATPEPPYFIDMAPGTTIAMINFNFDSGQLVPVQKAAIDRLIEMLKKEPSVTLNINGYTDNTGSKAANRQVSQQRAKTVADYLVRNGIAEDRLTLRGLGEAEPFATNETSHGRALNRRVELRIAD